MPTGQVIVNNVLTAIGVMRPGTLPSVPDSTDVLSELNVLLDEMSAQNALVYSVGAAQYLLAAAQASYQIGLGAADFNVARPSLITDAAIVSTVGSASSRAPLRIVGKTEYFGHRDLAAAGSSPEELYADYGMPYCTLYLFPAPSCPTVTHLELETWTQLAQMTLNGSVLFAPGYQALIQFELGFRLLGHFKITDQAVIEKTMRLAQDSTERVRELNVQSRLLDPALLEETRPRQRPAPAPQAAR